MSGAKKWAYLGVFTALSLICFLIENILPPMIVPGARLGLGNIFILLCLILYSLPEALILFAAKCLLAAIYGGAVSLIYSAVSGFLSLIVSFLLVKFAAKRLSVIAIAVVAAVVHNVTQLLVFALVTSAGEVMLYAPILIAAGAAAGAVSGFLSFLILKYFPFETRDIYKGES